MEVILDPIFYNSEESELVTNKSHYRKNNAYLNACSEDADKIEQQSDTRTVNGDSVQPQFQIIDIQWQQTIEEINFRPQVVDTWSYINGNSYPIERTFKLSWHANGEQRTTWRQQWGSEECHEYEAEFPNSNVSVKITHNQMGNISITSVPLSLTKSMQMNIAPRKTAIAHLVLSVSEIVELPFIATIKSISANENTSKFKVEGSWSGALHKVSSSSINMNETEIGIM